MAEKGKLSARAEALLHDMARDHGLRSLEFDKDGLIPIQTGGIQIPSPIAAPMTASS
jgi:hypothetical protein